MASEERDPLAERVLVYAPIGRDGELSSRVLQSAGLWTERSSTVDALCAELGVGAATLVMTEEALSGHSLDALSRALAAQPKWSDLPVVLCTTGGNVERASQLRARALEELGNVMVVERPMQTRTLLAAVRAGLRARLRQLALRDVVVELEHTAAERASLLVSEKRARTDAEDANRTKDEFLAMISHELRTPLNAILGWSRMLTGGLLAEPQRANALATIERNAVSQARLIDELLDVSRIISKKLRLSLRPVELRMIVESASESLRPSAEAKGLALALELGPRSVHVLGDADRLAQVVTNLLGNAIKFTPAGGTVHLVLEAEPGRGDGAGVASLRVSDDGIGIREELLPLVFDRFRQADSSRTRAHGGLGLGLAIVRHLVELHSGVVRAESEGVGRGSCFTLEVPLLDDDQVGALRGSDRPPSSILGALNGIRVVVVDDEPDARDLVAAVLERAGAVVTPVGSAEEAMLAFRERTPSLLVSDIGMPGEDGYALIARVRALPAERGGRVPAVAVTAFTRDEDKSRALRAGYTAHMAKPIDPSELVTVATNVTTHGSTLAGP